MPFSRARASQDCVGPCVSHSTSLPALCPFPAAGHEEHVKAPAAPPTLSLSQSPSGQSLQAPRLPIPIHSQGGRAEPSPSHGQRPEAVGQTLPGPSPSGLKRLQPIRTQERGSWGKQEEKEDGGSS